VIDQSKLVAYFDGLDSWLAPERNNRALYADNAELFPFWQAGFEHGRVVEPRRSFFVQAGGNKANSGKGC
jgi:hypothetical protein